VNSSACAALAGDRCGTTSRRRGATAGDWPLGDRVRGWSYVPAVAEATRCVLNLALVGDERPPVALGTASPRIRPG